MHYSKLLLAGLPLVAAIPIHTEIITIWETVTMTITNDGQVFTSVASVAETTITNVEHTTESQAFAGPTPAQDAVAAAIPTDVERQQVSPFEQVVDILSTTSSQAISTTSSEAAPPASSSSSSDSGSTGGSGCPIDPSSPVSPGVDGNPGVSMQESVNKIRKMYNPDAKCLGWSDSLATASQSCASGETESLLRANSAIVSDNGGYDKDPWFLGPQATTKFELSLFTLLCQDPQAKQLDGQCSGKVGEIGCSGGACTGHKDVLVDSAGEFNYVGAGVDPLTNWMSTSFSKTCSVFGDCDA